MSKFATGITVVTLEDDEGTQGMTVNAFMSISLKPTLIAVSIDKGASMFDRLMRTESFGVSILNEEQRHYSLIFARQKEAEEPIHYAYIDGVPVLENGLANLACKVVNKVEAGDHIIFIAEVTNLMIADGEPIIYFNSSYRTLADHE